MLLVWLGIMSPLQCYLCIPLSLYQSFSFTVTTYSQNKIDIQHHAVICVQASLLLLL